MNELLIVLILFSLITIPVASKAHSVMLASSWQDDGLHSNIFKHPPSYYMSEKFDGVRAIYKDGELITRNKNKISMPKWLEMQLSKCPKNCVLEGELWLGRNNFDELSGLVRSQNPMDSRWANVEFRIFDAPSVSGNFIDRKNWFENFVYEVNHAQIKTVQHQLIQNEKQMQQFYEIKIAQGAEGIMLINGFSQYQNKRSDDLIKRKPLLDAEAKVVGYTKGKGKFEGIMGALIVQDETGREFKIGTGFDLEQRAKPPEIGQKITFAYNGLTKNGLPRFARFIRIWDET